MNYLRGKGDGHSSMNWAHSPPLFPDSLDKSVGMESSVLSHDLYQTDFLPPRMLPAKVLATPAFFLVYDSLIYVFCMKDILVSISPFFSCDAKLSLSFSCLSDCFFSVDEKVLYLEVIAIPHWILAYLPRRTLSRCLLHCLG